MRALTIDAKSAESALALAQALKKFRPELAGNDNDGYRVTLDLGSFDVIEMLDALEQYVTEHNTQAPVEFDGRRYTVHSR